MQPKYELLSEQDFKMLAHAYALQKQKFDRDRDNNLEANKNYNKILKMENDLLAGYLSTKGQDNEL